MWSPVGGLLLVACLAAVRALPASLVDDIKSDELRENKVKRSSSTAEENSNIQYYNKPSASKRGANLKNPSAEQQVLNEWSQLQADSLPNLQSGLFDHRSAANMYDDKTIAEYEKGFRYGADKDKLDEALENAVLKSEFYEPGALNQYRYYGADDKRRRRRSAVKKFRLNPRLKREVELTPDEIITILNLYEKSRQPESSYRKWLERLEANGYGDGGDNNNNNNNNNNDGNGDDEDDDRTESWLDAPVVYPMHNNGPVYTVDDAPDKRGRWGGFADARAKRFMVAKKRSDPTRELRHLNGPNRNDYYALSAMLNEQRDPLYQRLML